MPRVAVLVNVVPPYRVSLLEELGSRVGELRVFVSATSEPNRSWAVNWGGLDVVVQRSLMVGKEWRSGAFRDTGYVHLPIDTISQLWRYKPDVIIAGELGLRSGLAAVYAALRRDARLILWATVSQLTERHRGRLRQWIRPGLLGRADAVLVNGASGARYVRSLGVPQAKITHIPYTVDVAQFACTHQHRPAGRTRRLLYVGLLVERKGVGDFLAALARWGGSHPSDSVELLLAGDGGERARLEQMPMPPNTRVVFLGNVPYEQLPQLYREADAFVLPTLEDEWGVVVNEAMAASLPVLGSVHSQAVEELVEDGGTGWTFSPDVAGSVDAALARVLACPTAELRRLGDAARQRAQCLTPAAVADRISEVVRCVAAR
jgi:glycosyltransferase involved in cell wall biosynthesis